MVGKRLATRTWVAGLITMGCGVLLSAAAETAPTPLISGTPLVEPAVQAIGDTNALPPFEGKNIRVGFYNIEMFTDGIKDGKNRTEALAINQAKGAGPIVEELASDILLISEIENERALEYLNSALSNPYPIGYVSLFGSESGRYEKMNIAMLSRIQPVSVDEIDFGPLTGKHRPTRGLFRAIFDLGDNHFLVVYAAHLKANWGDRTRNYAQRVNAFEILEADAKQLFANFPDRQWEALVIGDFNTDPLLKQFEDDPTLKVLDEWADLFSQHLDVSDLYTVPTRRGDPMREFPPALFDRVLAHPNLQQKPWSVSLPGVIMKGAETSDVSVLPGQGNHVSDHYPIYIDLMH
jgi:endonuclease/exonuclease/phosphatase family metal-dependent hydrolase